MPVRLRVGYPEPKGFVPEVLSEWHQLEPGIDQKLAQQAPVYAEFRIDELWNLWPLARISSYLAMGENLPAPWSPDQEPDYECWVRYIDLIDERGMPDYRSALLEAKAGIFVPAKSEVIEALAADPECGSHLSSLNLLWLELKILTGELFGHANDGSSDLPTLHDVRVRTEAAFPQSGYNLEQYILLSLYEASRLALSAQLPLYLDYFYHPKAEDTLMTSWDFHLHGFGQFSAAKITDDGRAMVIQFRSGYLYRIPFPYFKLWFEDIDTGCSRFESVRISRASSEVEIRLDCGYEVGLSPMHFLKRIEPSYDEFADLRPDYLDKLRPWLETAKERREISAPA